MAWIYIILAILCSVGLAHLLKTTEYKKLDRTKVITYNYLSASIVSVVQAISLNEPFIPSSIPVTVWFIAIYLGGMFITVFLILSRSIHINGVGISVTSMRVSLVLPVIAGLFYFDEIINFGQTIGIVLVLVALILIVKQKNSALHKPNAQSILLIMLFLFTGFNDILLKHYEVTYSEVLSESWFTSILFLSSFLFGIGYLTFKKNAKPCKTELKYGLSLGVINLYSTVFLLYALSDLNAAIVFPVLNISVVIGSTLIGIFRWDDKLDTFRWIGLIIACISLILLI